MPSGERVPEEAGGCGQPWARPAERESAGRVVHVAQGATRKPDVALSSSPATPLSGKVEHPTG